MICDFGISRRIHDANEQQFVAAFKEPKIDGATPIYASPEVLSFIMQIISSVV